MERKQKHSPLTAWWLLAFWGSLFPPFAMAAGVALRLVSQTGNGDILTAVEAVGVYIASVPLMQSLTFSMLISVASDCVVSGHSPGPFRIALGFIIGSLVILLIGFWVVVAPNAFATVTPTKQTVAALVATQFALTIVVLRFIYLIKRDQLNDIN
jgi:hypothetical protein